jgi:hypothetical protein
MATDLSRRETENKVEIEEEEGEDKDGEDGVLLLKHQLSQSKVYTVYYVVTGSSKSPI